MKEFAENAQREDEIAAFKRMEERLKGANIFGASSNKNIQSHPTKIDPAKKMSLNENPFGNYAPEMLKVFKLEAEEKLKSQKEKLESKKISEESKTLPQKKINQEMGLIDSDVPRMEWNDDSWISENWSEDEFAKSLYGDYGQDREKDQLRDILRAKKRKQSMLKSQIIAQEL